MSEEYNLKESVEGIGKLVPILKDAQGNIIDGFHREKIDPEWPSVKCETVDNPTKLALARLASNFCRRQVSTEELHEAIIFLVGKAGLTAKEIAEKTGISERTVYNHVPQTLKDEKKVKAGLTPKISAAPVQQTVTTSDTPTELPEEPYAMQVECDNCHMGTRKPRPFGRFNNLCEQCYVNAVKYPRLYARDPLIKPKAETFKPKETGDFRRARMHPATSKMDEAMLIRLQNNKQLREAGWRVEFQKPRTKILCISDVTLINDKAGREIDFFWDHIKTHKNSQIEDDLRRQEAAAIHNIEYQGFPYHANTETEQDRLEKLTEKTVAEEAIE